MASSSSEPGLKSESGGGGCGGEASEAAAAGDQLLLYRGLKKAKKERGCTAKERISKMPPCAAGKRSSIYRGVTRHRWTGRYEAHLWDKSTWNQNQNKKGKQGCSRAYDDEEAAARAYDLAALKYWGPGTLINFPVKDYTRDLEEMQNVSREEYLVSLRRKSSGFSRGVSKYRGLSSRWESSFSRIGGAEYFNSIYGAGEDPATESDFGGSFCIDRKIDLTSYIKWWGQNKTRQLDLATKSSEEIKHCSSDDINTELKTSEWEATEPYQMPRLGVPREGRKHKGSTLSALGTLSQSAAYKNLQEKTLKKQEKDHDNDDENKTTINRMDYGQPVEKSRSHEASEKQGATVGMSGTPPPQRNLYPLTSFLNAPLLTNYSSIDPLVDPVLWSSLVPVLPAGLSRTAEVPKSETSSTYTFVRPQE
ncbi:AP2-like ethylene-responsive transcription factor At2g41710 isoform X1 [Syzygium oleosum]|uniref:AP2-like ethylene-responsive transcription factor At2g41710 isoform X1 n=1 Tax=Syzygium oleosum TaxID=219896 RepID=UPI0024BB103A|nr:AP2-like ethylene-responsive transcription factor At2g41710 isoform X1 [Syzygium oleosum]